MVHLKIKENISDQTFLISLTKDFPEAFRSSSFSEIKQVKNKEEISWWQTIGYFIKVVYSSLHYPRPELVALQNKTETFYNLFSIVLFINDYHLSIIIWVANM